MNILFDNLESLIDAPNGIEKARELILQLAVQGKLTEQNPKDDPASELLKKILKDKDRLAAESMIKKQNELPPIKDEEKPFNLPNGWDWVRLGLVCDLINGRAYKRNELLDAGTPIIRIQNLTGGQNWYYSDLELTPEKYCSKGDLLFTWSGTFSPFIWWGEKAIFHYHTWKINLTNGLDKNFAYLLLKKISEEVKAKGHGIMLVHMTKDEMEKWIIPLPPLNEQQRIVEKVNSLMALLDELEEKRERRNQKRIKLNNASLEKLLTSKDDKELQTNWKRIEENFSTLYLVPENVEKLKQAILQLAVQGKLVKQDPKDEPTSELLKKIKKEKEKLIAEGKIKKQNELPPIKDEKKPFELPKGWEWVRFGDLIELISGQHIETVDYNFKRVGLPYITGPADFGLLCPIITKWTDKPKVIASKDDILITVKGAGLGKLNIINIDSLVISRQLMAIRPIQVNPNYIFHFLKSKFSLFQKSGTGIAIPGLSREDITYLCFPLPPLNEQKRIVEKVNELMSLCNTVEEKLTKKEETAEKLVGAVVNAVANKTNKPKDERASRHELIEELIKKHPKALAKLS